MGKFLLGMLAMYLFAAWSWGALFAFGGDVKGWSLFRATMLWPASAAELIQYAAGRTAPQPQGEAK